MLAGPLQALGYYNVSRVEKLANQKAVFPFLCPYMVCRVFWARTPNLTLLKYHPPGGAGGRDPEGYIS